MAGKKRTPQKKHEHYRQFCSFCGFIEYHSASRFSKNLRIMLLEFLQYDAIEAGYVNDLYDMGVCSHYLISLKLKGNQNRYGAR